MAVSGELTPGRVRWAAVGALMLMLIGCQRGEPGTSPDTHTHPATSQPHARAASDDVMVIAHRGASAYAPHGTVPAARQAIRRHADAVEIDLRQTRDGRLVTLHAKSLAPTTNAEQVYPDRAPWHVEDFTLGEIERLDAGSWFSPRYAGAAVPTLRRMLRVLRDSDLGVVLEPKTTARYPGMGGRLARVLRQHPTTSQRGRYVEVVCFEWDFMKRFHRRMPQVTIGLIGTPKPRRFAELSRWADAINPRVSSIDRRYVARAHQAGLEVKPWSVNTRRAMRQALRLGIDGLYSHKPDVLHQVVRQVD